MTDDDHQEDHGDLPAPHDGMTPEEKGDLLLRYVQVGAAFASLTPRGTLTDRRNFNEANLCGVDLTNAVLTGALLEGANLRRAKLVGADLQLVALQGADLREADLTGADIRRVSLRQTDLSGVSLDSVLVDGTRISETTYSLSGWSPQTLADLEIRGAVVHWNEFANEVSQATRRLLDRRRQGLTLSFDARLHRFDPTAFDAFIGDVLGRETNVTIEERSNIDAEGPTFIRINGSQAEDLVAVAEAFYDRMWQGTEAVVEEMAVEKAMSSGMAIILQRLNEMRDSWEDATINHPDVQEMLRDQSADHMVAKDTPANLHGRVERIAGGLADHAKNKLGKVIGRKTVDAVIDATVETAEDARSWKNQRDTERWDQKIARDELAEPESETD